LKNPLPREHHFHIPCQPPKATHQSALRVFKSKSGKTFVGKSSKGRQTESQLLLLLEPHRPKSPLKGPLKMKVLWNYPFRKSETKKNREKGTIPCPSRPDCDNLQKFLCDCMERLGFFETGDAQIYDIHFIKSWSKTQGITITISEQ
jgi:Holliday junction resolvase RusA-like endonuclease